MERAHSSGMKQWLHFAKEFPESRIWLPRASYWLPTLVIAAVWAFFAFLFTLSGPIVMFAAAPGLGILTFYWAYFFLPLGLHMGYTWPRILLTMVLLISLLSTAAFWLAKYMIWMLVHGQMGF